VPRPMGAFGAVRAQPGTAIELAGRAQAAHAVARRAAVAAPAGRGAARGCIRGSESGGPHPRAAASGSTAAAPRGAAPPRRARAPPPPLPAAAARGADGAARARCRPACGAPRARMAAAPPLPPAPRAPRRRPRQTARPQPRRLQRFPRASAVCGPRASASCGAPPCLCRGWLPAPAPPDPRPRLSHGPQPPPALTTQRCRAARQPRRAARLPQGAPRRLLPSQHPLVHETPRPVRAAPQREPHSRARCLTRLRPRRRHRCPAHWHWHRCCRSCSAHARTQAGPQAPAARWRTRCSARAVRHRLVVRPMAQACQCEADALSGRQATA